MSPRQSSLQLPKPSSRFSLILAGGLARGAAHLGAWRALSDAQLVPERVVGVSIGAIVGAWLCKEGCTEETSARLRYLARSVHKDLSANKRNIKSFWELRHLMSFGQRRSFVEEKLGMKGLTFGELPLPLYVAATRLIPPGRVVFGDDPDGSVAEAILASTAVPSHLPVRAGHSYYLDGGLSGNLPVSEAAKRGARVVLAVSLGSPVRDGRGKARKVLWRVCRDIYRLSTLREIEGSRARGITVLQVSSPEIESHGLFSFEKLDMIEEHGYKATQCVLPALLQALGRPGGNEPSTSELQGGTGGS
ncbi:MAG: patatin-like phospholipase family protein [candidate division NC10 bacterium]